MAHETTQPSLLLRVRNVADDDAWREFEAKYDELISRYCRRRGLQPADCADVKQTTWLLLAKGLRNFDYDPKRGRFRDYLYRVVRSAMTRHFARPNPAKLALDTNMQAAVPRDDSSGPDTAWEQEWVDHHYRLAMRTVHETFEPRSVQIFDRLVAGETVAAVSETSGLSPQAVHKIKQRIKARMQELIAAQIREEDEPVCTNS